MTIQFAKGQIFSAPFLGSIISGIIGGILTVLFLWWWKVKLHAPRVEFGEYIAKVKSRTDRDVYLIRIINTGTRKLINVNVQVILRIPGIVHDDVSRAQEFIVDVDSSRLILDNRAITKSLRLCKTEQIVKYGFFKPEINDKCRVGEGVLEYLMGLHEDSKLYVIVVGCDELTGVTKGFQSKNYKKEDIKEGRFPQDKYDVLF